MDPEFPEQEPTPPTPLSLAERIVIARQPGTFADQVTGALVKHARWVIDASQPAESTALARAVINDPSAYTQRFATLLLLHPGNDGWIDALAEVTPGTVTDGAVMDMIQTLWGSFVEPAE